MVASLISNPVRLSHWCHQMVSTTTNTVARIPRVSLRRALVTFSGSRDRSALTSLTSAPSAKSDLIFEANGEVIPLGEIAVIMREVLSLVRNPRKLRVSVSRCAVSVCF